MSPIAARNWSEQDQYQSTAHTFVLRSLQKWLFPFLLISRRNPLSSHSHRCQMNSDLSPGLSGIFHSSGLKPTGTPDKREIKKNIFHGTVESHQPWLGRECHQLTAASLRRYRPSASPGTCSTAGRARLTCSSRRGGESARPSRGVSHSFWRRAWSARRRQSLPRHSSS